MIQFPMKFEVDAVSSGGIGSSWISQSGDLAPIPCSIPVEFKGPGSGYSPEDLFALSVINCLIATYKVYSEKSKVAFSEIRAKAILTVDKNPDAPGFIMSQIEISIKITGSPDPDLAKKILDSAISDCAIANSIKTKKVFYSDIVKLSQ